MPILLKKHSDKLLHAAFSYVLADVFFSIFMHLWGAALVAFLMGLMKEVVDENTRKEHFLDVCANLVGIGLFIGFVFLGRWLHEGTNF